MSEPSQTDVIAVLLDQHAEIRRLFAEVDQRRGQPRREAFEQLVRLLAVHETAEQEVLHPQVRLLVAGGQAIADVRLEEERHAKELLAQLDELGPEAEGFDQRLDAVHKAVLNHARHEEREEFPRLRDSSSSVQLEAMGVAVRVAEATAPTHAHPPGGGNSLAANLAAGPMLAVADRTRDLVRAALRSTQGLGVDTAEEAPKRRARKRPERSRPGKGDGSKGAPRRRDRRPDRRPLEERNLKELRERARMLQIPVARRCARTSWSPPCASTPSSMARPLISR